MRAYPTVEALYIIQVAARVTMKKHDKISSKPSTQLAVLAFLAWNGAYLFFVCFNLCLIFGSSFITLSPLIGTRTLALLFYAGFYVLMPCGGLKCHLKDGNPWRAFSEKWYPPFKLMRSYLDFNFGELPKDLVEAEAKPNAQFIIAGFPHGSGADFRVLLEGCIQDIMPNIVKNDNFRTLAASVLFQIPLFRDLALWTGCIDANRKTATKALDRGRSLLVLPGGEAEQLLTTYGKEQVYLSSRKGFVKLAMRKNISVVPMYVFGSNDLFYTSSFLMGPRKFLMKKFGICIPFCFGLLGSLCPLPKRTTIVFGSPLKFAIKGTEPTDDELDLAHQTFCKELKNLFDSHKDSLGYGDRELEIL
jgi:1-acyl-sn-glycerol-3-phosphate acyltransferase